MALLKISDEAKKKIEAMRRRELRKQEKSIFKLLDELGFELNNGAKLREQLEAAKTAAPELFAETEQETEQGKKKSDEKEPGSEADTDTTATYY